jgi:hypothetical protein
MQTFGTNGLITSIIEIHIQRCDTRLYFPFGVLSRFAARVFHVYINHVSSSYGQKKSRISVLESRF